MKETNTKRKLALKKAKDARDRKKSLQYDIAEFLFAFRVKTTEDPLTNWCEMLRNGFKGYHGVNNRTLLNVFEEAYKLLRDGKALLLFYAPVDIDGSNFYYGNVYGKHEGLDSEESAKVRADLMLTSDALMSRLMELAFNLDVED